MSAYTAQKAQNLIDTESIIQIDENTFQVRSSVVGKSYIIESGICECVGFRYRKGCSHVQAVQILQKKTLIPSKENRHHQDSPQKARKIFLKK
jgi:predicted nucleic acid-binding Zn finger protein